MSLFDRLVTDCASEWREYTDHDFVRQMGEGTLSKECFQHYLKQDYLFLIHFARAYALAIYKGRDLAEMRSSLEGLKAILDVEMDLHVRLCAEWGISAEALEDLPESTATVAYTRFVLDAGNRGDLLDLKIALAPCMIGYGKIAAALAEKATSDNPYSVWINEYASEGYQELTDSTIADLDRLAETSFTEARYEQLKKLFSAATLLEADFWQMGLDLS